MQCHAVTNRTFASVRTGLLLRRAKPSREELLIAVVVATRIFPTLLA